MSYLELLWIPAVLGWIPLIYADELSSLRASAVDVDSRATDTPDDGGAELPAQRAP